MDLRVLYTNYRDIQNSVPVGETITSNVFLHDVKMQYVKQFHGIHYNELQRLYEQAQRDYVSCQSQSTLEYKNKCERDLYGKLMD